MKLLSSLPEEIRQIVRAIPGLALHSVSYVDLFRAISKTGKNYFSEELPASLKNEAKGLCPAGLHLSFSNPPSEFVPTTLSKVHAEKILQLYFGQLRSHRGVFLDLRQKMFSYHPELTWSPGKLWHLFEEDFLHSLRQLYHAYYHEDSTTFLEALEKLGLTRGVGASESQQLKELFYRHFGSDPHQVTFSTEHFTQSFAAIFEFLHRHKVKVPIDFVFLGIYLTTLYQHLSCCPEALDVKSSYLTTL